VIQARAMETSLQRQIYLDANATAPLRPSARAAIGRALDLFGNPSSIHHQGRAARALVEDAREAIAKAVNARPADVVFTSGATEANGLALRGAGCTAILAASVEHPSVLAHVLPENQLPVDGNGCIDLAALDAVLARHAAPVCVAIMAANNETGVIQPVAQVVEIARRYGAWVHCDAVQALGKMPLDFAALGADSMALSGHKVGAAKGVGALILRPGREVLAQSLGGGQERRRRAGTENTLGIASFGAVMAEMDALLATAPQVVVLRDRVEAELRARVPTLQFFGAASPRVFNTTCFALPGVPSATQIMNLDLAKIAVSAGSACSSGKVTPSQVLLAMGISSDLAACALRVSLGWETTTEEITRFMAVFVGIAEKQVGTSPLAVAAGS